MSNDRIEFLAMKFLTGSATKAEEEELHAWYDSFHDDEELVVVTRESETFDSKRERIRMGLQKRMEHHAAAQAPVKPLFRRAAFLRAAAVIFMLGLAIAAIYLTRREDTPVPMAQSQGTEQRGTDQKQQIILRLADGTTIALDSAGKGVVSTQGGTEIVKGDDGLTYQGGNVQPGEMLYNTVSIPKGQQLRISLPDGSRVWLNSSSSLQFPVAFNGKERAVKLTGEGYFDIAKNPGQPFKVDVNGKCEVEVLGTEFNINAYDNAATLNTTLIEGKLRVSPVANNKAEREASQILAPGQQAQLRAGGQLIISNQVDTTAVLAWKNGYFRFVDATMEEILKQAEQWYDIGQVTYHGIIEDRFYSTIPRNATLSQFLDILEKTGQVHFTVTGKNIEIFP